MSELTVEERDELLEKLLPIAAQVVGAVRTRDGEHLAKLVEPLDRTQLIALLIDVSAMVPDDQTIADLVLWTHGPDVSDEQYKQLTAFSVRPGMKFCTWCKEWWRLEEFQKLATARDGRRSQCRACRTERDKNRPADAGEAEEVAA